MENKWGTVEARIILQAILDRIDKGDGSFRVRVESEDIVITETGFNERKLYISIPKDKEYVYISLQDIKCTVTPSIFWFKDIELKKLIKTFQSRYKNSQKPVHKILVECFPEIVGSEFEREVLGIKQ